MLSTGRVDAVKPVTTFEVRMPTCDRPEMLRRAVKSLQAQSYPHWKAIIFDDSSSSDSRDVIQSIADDRISYVRNLQRLGAAVNIDQCFSPAKALGGDYGCLLEDDNFWLPDFLTLIANQIGNGRWELILANQRICEEGIGLRPASETTRGDWFSAGNVGPLYLRATLLLMEGVSNGGLVWRLGGETDLQVGPKVRETGLQEACRSLLVKTTFLFIEEPQAVWTLMPKSKSARASETNRLFGRGTQSIRDFVLRVHGRSIVRVARSLAEDLGLTSRLVEALAYTGHPILAGELLKGRARLVCRALAKGLAIRLFERDPCEAFLGSLSVKIPVSGNHSPGSEKIELNRKSKLRCCYFL
jgi:glycosyltransferase involved in cell wall biosynthesis